MVNWCTREAYSGPLGRPYGGSFMDARDRSISLALDLRRGFDTKLANYVAASARVYITLVSMDDFKSAWKNSVLLRCGRLT